MRIKVVLKRYKPDTFIGGAESFAARVSQQWVRDNHHVSVASAQYRPAWPKHETIKVENTNDKTISVERFSHPRVRLVGTFVYNLALFWHLLKDRNHYDVVFVSHASYDAITCALAGLVTKRPVVCKSAASGGKGDLRRMGVLNRQLMKLVNRFVAINREIVKELATMGFDPQRIDRVPNGVDTNAFAPPTATDRQQARDTLGVSPDTCLVLSVGRLCEQKSFETLIHALAQTDDHDVFGVIVGGGPDQEKLLRRVRDEGLEERLLITSASDVRPFLHAADIFVLPSRWEGLSNALLEAASTALPCVVSNIPGNAEFVVDGVSGRLFDTDDIDQLTAILNTLISDRNARHVLGNNALQRVSDDFSIDVISTRYARCFESAAAGTRPWRPARSRVTP